MVFLVHGSVDPFSKGLYKKQVTRKLHAHRLGVVGHGREDLFGLVVEHVDVKQRSVGQLRRHQLKHSRRLPLAGESFGLFFALDLFALDVTKTKENLRLRDVDVVQGLRLPVYVGKEIRHDDVERVLVPFIALELVAREYDAELQAREPLLRRNSGKTFLFEIGGQEGVLLVLHR